MGSGDCTTIAEALAAAAPGGLIVVRPGSYAEPLVIATGVVLAADEGRATVVVEGAVSIESDRVTLDGLTLAAGLVCTSGHVTLVREGARPTLESCRHPDRNRGRGRRRRSARELHGERGVGGWARALRRQRRLVPRLHHRGKRRRRLLPGRRGRQHRGLRPAGLQRRCLAHRASRPDRAHGQEGRRRRRTGADAPASRRGAPWRRSCSVWTPSRGSPRSRSRCGL